MFLAAVSSTMRFTSAVYVSDATNKLVHPRPSGEVVRVIRPLPHNVTARSLYPPMFSPKASSPLTWKDGCRTRDPSKIVGAAYSHADMLKFESL